MYAKTQLISDVEVKCLIRQYLSAVKLKPHVAAIMARNTNRLLETYPCQIADVEAKAAAVVVDVVSHVEGARVVGR